jgi:Flp pilus assembly protein TadB
MRIKWWKVLGLAGVVGVAATGVVVARAERRRRAYTPEEIRTRLHERHTAAIAQSGTSRGSRTSDTGGHLG